jgi:hypothetical protein
MVAKHLGWDHETRSSAMSRKRAAVFPQRNAPPENARLDGVRETALYNFGMWCFMDADRLGKIFKARAAGEQLTLDAMQRPDTSKRSAIQSAFDGRYKFNRYFNMESHNRPTTMEQIFAVNDVELFDLESDPHEMNNLALDKKKNGELIMAMNDKRKACHTGSNRSTHGSR